MKTETKNKIVAEIKSEIAWRTQDNPELSLSENAAAAKDLVEHVSDLARAKERLNKADWTEWCLWFWLSDREKLAIVKEARAK